jgi:hypothetical protein
MSYDFEAGSSHYAWVKVESHADHREIFAATKGTASTPLLQIRLTASGAVQSLHRNEAVQISNATSSATISTGVWAHVVYVAASASSHTTYINGSAETTETTSVPFSGAQDELHQIAIGAFYDSGGGQSLYFDGKIGYVTVWNTNLSGANVSSLYNSGSGVDPTTIANGNVVHNWPLTANLNDTVGSVNFTGYNSVALSSPADDPISAGGPVTLALGGSASTSAHGTQSPVFTIGL